MSKTRMISHTYNQMAVAQRARDGYINATQACQSCGKKLNDYTRLESTQRFLEALNIETGIPVSMLVQIRKGGVVELQGTWVHPQVAINLGQWLSPEFAVAVSKWVWEWMSTGKVPEHPVYGGQGVSLVELQQQVIVLQQEMLEMRKKYESLPLKGGTHRAFTEEEKAQLLAMRRSGMNVREIGEKLGRHYNTCWKALDRMRQEAMVCGEKVPEGASYVNKAKGRVTDQEKRRMRTLYQKGIGVSVIAMSTGRSMGTIYAVLKNCGFEFEKRGRG